MELSEKIPEGDYLNDAIAMLVDEDYNPAFFEDLPSLTNLQIPQELFTLFNCKLTLQECMHQVTSTSLGVIKKAKVIYFDDDKLSFVVTEGLYPGRLILIDILEPEEKFGLIGLILKLKG